MRVLLLLKLFSLVISASGAAAVGLQASIHVTMFTELLCVM
jgi:peroxiredoxin family protein